MNPIVRADERAWAAVDAAVLWLWDELGVAWRELCKGVVIAVFVLAILDSWRDGPGTFDFWLSALIIGFCQGGCWLVVSITPTAAFGPSNRRQRVGWFSILLRLYLVATIAAGAHRGDVLRCASGVAFLAQWMTLLATPPNRPRRPRRAPALAYALGGAR